jgi:hypothetical protein
MAKDHTHYRGLFRGPHVEKYSGVPMCLNYCEIFVVDTYVVYKCGRWPRVGEACFKRLNTTREVNLVLN